jgi:hypothetical protein
MKTVIEVSVVTEKGTTSKVSKTLKESLELIDCKLNELRNIKICYDQQRI